MTTIRRQERGAAPAASSSCLLHSGALGAANRSEQETTTQNTGFQVFITATSEAWLAVGRTYPCAHAREARTMVPEALVPSDSLQCGWQHGRASISAHGAANPRNRRPDACAQISSMWQRARAQSLLTPRPRGTVGRGHKCTTRCMVCSFVRVPGAVLGEPLHSARSCGIAWPR